MTDTGEPPLTLDLEPGTVPPLVAARRWASRALSDLGEDHLIAVQLIATELLTNAYEHAAGAVQLRLRRDRDPCRIHVEVDDDASRPPVLRDPGPTAPGGRGLVLVDKLADQWGSLPRSGGKTVWAVVDCGAYSWQRCV